MTLCVRFSSGIRGIIGDSVLLNPSELGVSGVPGDLTVGLERVGTFGGVRGKEVETVKPSTAGDVRPCNIIVHYRTRHCSANVFDDGALSIFRSSPLCKMIQKRRLNRTTM